MLNPRTATPQQAQPKTRESLVNQINEAFEKIAVVRAKAFDAKVDMPPFEKLTFDSDFLSVEEQDPQKKTPAVLSSKIQALTTALASLDNAETKGSFADIGNELKNKLGVNVDSLFNRVARGEMNPTDLQTDIEKLMGECRQEIGAEINEQFINKNNQFKPVLEAEENLSTCNDALLKARKELKTEEKGTLTQDEQKAADEANRNYATAQAALKTAKEAQEAALQRLTDDEKKSLDSLKAQKKQCEDLLAEIEKDALDKELARIARVLESQHAIEWSELQRGLAKEIGGVLNPHPLKRIDKPEAFGDEKKASFFALNQLVDGTYSREGSKIDLVVKNGSISPLGNPPITLQSSPTRFEQAWREVIELFATRSPDKIIVFSDHQNPSFDEMKKLLAMAHQRGVMAEVDESTINHKNMTKPQREELRKIMRDNKAALEGKEKEIKDNIAKINESTKELQTHNLIVGDQKNPPSPEQIEAAITAMQNAFNHHQSNIEKDYVAVDKLKSEMNSIISAIEGKNLGTKTNEFEQVKNSVQAIEKQQFSYDAALTKPITLDAEKIKEKIYQAAGKDYQDKGWITKNVTGAGRHIEEIASLHEGIVAKWHEYATQQKDAGKAMTQQGFESFLQGKMLEGAPANKGMLSDATFSAATAVLGSKIVGRVDKFLTDKDAAGIAAVVFEAYTKGLQLAPAPALAPPGGGGVVPGSGVSMEEEKPAPFAVTMSADNSDASLSLGGGNEQSKSGPEHSITESSVGARYELDDEPSQRDTEHSVNISEEELEKKYDSGSTLSAAETSATQLSEGAVHLDDVGVTFHMGAENESKDTVEQAKSEAETEGDLERELASALNEAKTEDDRNKAFEDALLYAEKWMNDTDNKYSVLTDEFAEAVSKAEYTGDKWSEDDIKEKVNQIREKTELDDDQSPRFG
jgi:hypothetical protein